MFGGGPHRISVVLHEPLSVGKRLSEAFDDAYPEFHAWKRETVLNRMMDLGYASTWFGQAAVSARYLVGQQRGYRGGVASRRLGGSARHRRGCNENRHR